MHILGSYGEKNNKLRHMTTEKTFLYSKHLPAPMLWKFSCMLDIYIKQTCNLATWTMRKKKAESKK